MSGIDVQVVLEALSALTGATVNPLSKLKEGTTADFLTIDNFLPTVYGVGSVAPGFDANPNVSYLSSLVKALFLNSSKAKEQETEASALRKELFVDMEKFFNPLLDYDFRNGSDSSKCSRGGEPYSRPWGWYRFALNVQNKYPDGNVWLGSGGWRSQSSPGEWPVSFHGTTIEGARGIAASRYTVGTRQAFGPGIYSTPNVRIADGYTTKFTSKNGKKYKVIMQNRINPEKRVIIDIMNYWLIEVPEGTTPEMEKKIVEESIRPYGILIKEATDVSLHGIKFNTD